MTTTIKLPVEFDNLLDSIIGSGATYTWSWYHSVREFPELGAHSVGMVGGGHVVLYALVDANTLATTIEGIIENHKPGWQTVLHSALNDDFDADAGDIVLQYAVLGELVWG